MSVNGRLPASDLATIPGTSRRVRADLLAQVVAMRAEFHGHLGKPLVVTDAYRPHDEQVDVFLRYYTTTYQPGRPSRVWNGVRYWQRPGFPSAAVPGTSNHGWGTALDLGSGVNTSLTSPEHLWLRANAHRFGFTHPAWAHDHIDSNGTDEPWHWEAVGVVPVTNPVGSVGPVPTVPPVPTVEPPDPIDPPEDDVAVTYTIITTTGTSTWALHTSDHPYEKHLLAPGEVQIRRDLGLIPKEVAEEALGPRGPKWVPNSYFDSLRNI